MSHRDIPWMTRADVAILKELHRADMIHTVRLIGYQTEYTRGYVSERLQELKKHGLVEQPSEDEIPDDESTEGLYRITDRGRAFLNRELDPSDLK